ncbi:hypothetical protein GCK72_022399 [Caenorhabditis remanei]|uniref:Uncharacterized protein n=1 Tax=Caenorhabditis remanei TaxID=31234 RepID=A0A6A5FU88_CAERE|nr:hypothetical protein GCK72_022399 [Caenorhabditis remanei]KAF1745951.1 hypothetical protein GCK72_022399 [Caenorhabditis remanei]
MINLVAPSDGTFTARELFSYHETPTAEVYTDKNVVVHCEDPKKVGSHYHCATVEGKCTIMNKGNCNVAVKVAPR